MVLDLLGNVVSRGLEFSVAGAITPKLDVVAGGVLLRPRVTGEGVALGRVGERPVGLAARSIDLNADWRPSILDGLSLDIGVSHTSDVTATRDNVVSIPARTLVDIGAAIDSVWAATALRYVLRSAIWLTSMATIFVARARMTPSQGVSPQPTSPSISERSILDVENKHC